MSSMIAGSRSIGTTMLTSRRSCRPLECCTCNEPIPISIPSAEISAAAAPERMRRRGKDRAVEQVFPMPGKFLTGDHGGGDRMAPPALGGDDRLVAGADADPGAELGSAIPTAAQAPAPGRTRSPGRNPTECPATAPPTVEVSQIDSASVIR